MQQDNTIFATMFVYGTDDKPTWYIATLKPTSGTYIFGGTLYQTTGPWLGAPWNASLTSLTPVGTMSFNGSLVASGTLTYSVNGTTVNKTISRSTFVHDDLSGTYAGIMNMQKAGGDCTGYGIGKAVEAEFVFDHDPASEYANVGLVTSGDTCTALNVPVTQSGQFLHVSGAFTCMGGDKGTWTIVEAKPSYANIVFRFDYLSSNAGACHVSAHYAGVRE